MAAEYDDADILPTVISLAFGDEHVGIRIAAYGLDPDDLPAFVITRSKRSIGSLSASKFASIFGTTTPALRGPYRDSEGPHVTTDGTPYTPYHCEGYDGRVTSEMQIDGRLFPVEFDECVSVSEIDVADGIVWIGTYYDGSHGPWGAQGLLAASRLSGEIIGRIDTGKYPVYNVRYDSTVKHVWAITRDQIVVVDDDMNVVSRFFFYYDFNQSTGHPEVRLANERISSHPLAVFALHLPPTYYQHFFGAVNTIPDDKARQFDLYDFYMCCYFAPAGEPSRRPKEFEILIPYLLPAFEKDLPRWEYNGSSRSKSASRMWRQVACNHRSNAEAARLCDTEDWGDLINLE